MVINFIDENNEVVKNEEVRSEPVTARPIMDEDPIAKKYTEMSITKALVIKKRLKNEIDEAIKSLPPLYIYIQDDVSPSGFKSIEEFKKERNSMYQSIKDKITRYYRIVTAMAHANATTNVEIGNKSYSLAGALEYKKSINMEKELFAKLHTQQQTMIKQGDSLAKSAEEKIEISMNQLIGKDKKVESANVEEIMSTLRAKYGYTLHEAVDLTSVITSDYDKLNTFISDVDVLLTEVNSRTMLQIED